MAASRFFDRLGIAATTDVRTIKRAYARALKGVDQQTEREAFERLREAYEEALAWARLHAEVESPAVPRSGARGAQVGGDPGGRTAEAEGEGVHANGAAQVETDDSRARGETDACDGLDGHHGVDDEDDDGDDGDGSGDSDDTDSATDDVDDDPNPTWSAIHHWVTRLTQPGETSPAGLLDEALDDPRLWHLDGRKQFETRLIAALHRDPLGQAPLFEAASARFDWPARRASGNRSHRHERWVSRVIDQALLWESLPAAERGKLARAMKAVRATGMPTTRQVFRHQPALHALQRDLLEWSSLFLAPARVDAWRNAFEALPANDLRRFRMERGLVAILAWMWRIVMAIFRFMRDNVFDTWLYRLAGGFLLVAFVATWLAGGFEGDHRSAAQQNTDNVMRIAQANAGRVGRYAPREAGQPMPVPILDLPGKLDRRSCRATHAVLHKRDPAVFDDSELIASLGAHAMLCTVNYRWPAMADPIVRCLELESWSANNQRRPQNNAHCVRAQAKP